MGEQLKRIKGSGAMRKFIKHTKISRSEAIVAFCFECLGGENTFDCETRTCSLYQFSPYRKSKDIKASDDEWLRDRGIDRSKL